jgi:hypothetical protein
VSVGYTPGPWLLEPRFVYALNRHQINRFSLMIQSGYADEGRTSNEELEANARLIAAAPELYEALDAICAEAERMTFTMRRRKIFNAGIAALRKARGEA